MPCRNGPWTFLRILRETDGLTQRELSAQAGAVEPTSFAAVRAMEAMGFVERQQMPDNKKERACFPDRTRACIARQKRAACRESQRHQRGGNERTRRENRAQIVARRDRIFGRG